MPRRKGRARTEDVSTPRPRNGNTYAVGAYLQELRDSAGLTREPLVRQIINDMAGNITMSLSTLTQIEGGKNKSVSAATIDAIRQAVKGDPYDISYLWRVPIPDDEDADGIAQSRFEGRSKAIERWKQLRSSNVLQSIAGDNIDPELRAMLEKVATDTRLQSVVRQLVDDSTALEFVLAILKARGQV